jgi:hypothetical protein
MNIMNIMKDFRGVEGYAEKKHVFFISASVLRPFSCSYFYIMFINLAMRSKIARFVRQSTVVIKYFMNIMKVYEGGVFMAIFYKGGFGLGEFMNLPLRPYFIEVHKLGD